MPKLHHINYNKLEGSSPTVMFFTGFRSDMEGSKATYLESLCKEQGIGYVRFDYSGHGKSDGEFKECTIGTWKADALKVIDELTEGELVLVGSSMGGWIMLLAALARPDRVKGILGLASAPDFTEDLMWEEMDEFSQHKLLKDGVVYIPNCYDDQEPYPITLKLIEEGREHLLLQGIISLTCPARFIHGMEDKDVPFDTSLMVAEQIQSTDVKVELLKSSGHRLSEPHELEIIKRNLLELI